jgi:hypothetical protein
VYLLLDSYKHTLALVLIKSSNSDSNYVAESSKLYTLQILSLAEIWARHLLDISDEERITQHRLVYLRQASGKLPKQPVCVRQNIWGGC